MILSHVILSHQVSPGVLASRGDMSSSAGCPGPCNLHAAVASQQPLRVVGGEVVLAKLAQWMMCLLCWLSFRSMVGWCAGSGRFTGGMLCAVPQPF